MPAYSSDMIVANLVNGSIQYGQQGSGKVTHTRVSNTIIIVSMVIMFILTIIYSRT